MTPPLKLLQEEKGKPNLIFLIKESHLLYYHLKSPPWTLLFVLRHRAGPALNSIINNTVKASQLRCLRLVNPYKAKWYQKH